MDSHRRFLWIAGVVTLAITALRLFAEVSDWDAFLASRKGGGAGAVIGISWLMFVVGGMLGWRLAGQGERMTWRRVGGLWLNTLLPMLIGVSVIAVAQSQSAENDYAFVYAIAFNGVIYSLFAWRAFRLWPAIGRPLLAYGLLARIPVAILTVIAVLCEWGTHYEVVGPGDGVDAPPGIAILCLVSAQLFVWIPFTILFGGVMGAMANHLRPPRPR